MHISSYLNSFVKEVKNNPYKNKKLPPPRVPYVAKKGDELDNMLAGAINADLHHLISPNSIQRLGNGKVCFKRLKLLTFILVYIWYCQSSFTFCKRHTNCKSKYIF